MWEVKKQKKNNEEGEGKNQAVKLKQLKLKKLKLEQLKIGKAEIGTV